MPVGRHRATVPPTLGTCMSTAKCHATFVKMTAAVEVAAAAAAAVEIVSTCLLSFDRTPMIFVSYDWSVIPLYHICTKDDKAFVYVIVFQCTFVYKYITTQSCLQKIFF